MWSLGLSHLIPYSAHYGFSIVVIIVHLMFGKLHHRDFMGAASDTIRNNDLITTSLSLQLLVFLFSPFLWCLSLRLRIYSVVWCMIFLYPGMIIWIPSIPEDILHVCICNSVGSDYAINEITVPLFSHKNAFANAFLNYFICLDT